MAQADTKDRILDAAERLFADAGIEATSLRAITTAADVNLAAVNYHFGSKEGLIESVFARRLEPLNRERLERLETLEGAASGGPVPLERILEAFLEPPLRRRLDKEEGLGLCMRLMGRTFSGAPGPARDILIGQFQEVARRFHAALCRALPDLDPGETFWRLFFLVGVMAHTLAAADLLERVSGGACNPDDGDALLRRMIAFTGAGMLAPPGAAAEGPP